MSDSRREKLRVNDFVVKRSPAILHGEMQVITCAIVLVLLHGAMTWLSHEFVYTRPLADKPILSLVALQLAAGAVFLLAVRRMLGDEQPLANRLPLILGIGIALRIVTLPSTPVLENDFYRYLWDGALTAHGINPYLYAPAQVLDPDSALPPLVRQLADQSGAVVFRISYLHLRTIYPPVAQAAFAAAYLLHPWSLWAWKAVLALFDVGTLVLLVTALRGIGASPACSLIYWWNPLVVREIYNTLHMDIIAVPLALAAILLWSRKNRVAAMLPLILAVGTKLWPVVLLPVLFLPLRNGLRQNLAPLVMFGIGCALIGAPQILSRLDEGSGLLAYGTTWEMNDGVYMLLLWAAEQLGALGAWGAAGVQIAARSLAVCLLAGLIVWSCRHRASAPSEFWRRSLFAVAALFLLSPTQFPWYYLWVVPFLVMRYRFSLVLLSVLLSLYYARFFFLAHGNVHVFDTYVVWVEYVPVAVLLLYEWLFLRQDGRGCMQGQGR